MILCSILDVEILVKRCRKTLLNNMWYMVERVATRTQEIEQPVFDAPVTVKAVAKENVTVLTITVTGVIWKWNTSKVSVKSKYIYLDRNIVYAQSWAQMAKQKQCIGGMEHQSW